MQDNRHINRLDIKGSPTVVRKNFLPTFFKLVLNGRAPIQNVADLMAQLFVDRITFDLITKSNKQMPFEYLEKINKLIQEYNVKQEKWGKELIQAIKESIFELQDKVNQRNNSNQMMPIVS